MMKARILVFVAAFAAVLFSAITITTAQKKETYFMKDGNVIFHSPISDVDSIIFYEPCVYLSTSIAKRGDGFSLDDDYTAMSGAVTTLCGRTGTSTFTAGAFSIATFNSPKHLVCDADGNIFLVHESANLMALIDLKKQTVKSVCTFNNVPNSPCVDATGKIILVPSNGTPDGYWKLEPGNEWNGGNMKTFLHPTSEEIAGGVEDFDIMAYKHSFALCATDGKLYMRGNQDGAIIRFDPVTGKGERALSDTGQKLWMLQNPTPGPGNALNADAYLVFDPRQPHILYGALAGRHCIAYLNIKTGENGVFAGNAGSAGWQDGALTTAKFRNPKQTTIDNDGNLIIADADNHCIRKINLSTGIVSTVAGSPMQMEGHKDGPANIARFNRPWGVCVGKDGAIYVADSGNKCIRKIWPVIPMASVESFSSLRMANDLWETADKVGLYMVKTGMELTEKDAIVDKASNVSMEVKANQLISNPPLYYPEQGNVDFVAYYPHTNAVNTDYTIAVNIANQTGSLPEILYSNNATDRNAFKDAVPLVFRYSFAKLIVTVKSSFLTEKDFKAITVSLEGLHTRAKFQLKDGTFTDYDGKQSITLHKTSATATEAVFEALVLPADISAGDAEFVITAGNDICRFSAKGNYTAGKQYRFNYTLNVKAPAVSGVKFADPLPVMDIKNLNYVMIPIIEPANAFDTNVTWTSSIPAVAEINENGKIKPKTTGTTTITVTTADGGHQATCLLSVENSDTRYANPVIRRSVPDPHVLRAEDGYFYMVGTGGNIPIYRSTDLVNWESKGTAFTNETRPPNYLGIYGRTGDLWAPELNYINGKYVMYYSMSSGSGPPIPAGIIGVALIGVATADKPEGPYTNDSIVFRSNTIGVKNSIDQTYIEDGGKKYLFWGSFNGIWGIELNNDGLRVNGDSVWATNAKKQIAGTAYEGSYIHKRNGYYYLFASIGTCCNDLASTYTTVVGRSKNLFGPYTDKQGKSMMQNNHEILIDRNHAFVGLGHNSPLIQDKAGNDWIIYHGYWTDYNVGRQVFLDKIVWIDDWPTVAGGSPSTEADIPDFK